MNPAPILPGNAQHRGDRAQQQDSFGFSDLLNPTLLARQGALAVLADGMGGHALGREASRIAVKTFLDGYPHSAPDEPIPTTLRRLMQNANTAVRILAAAEGELDNTGTTLAAAVIHQQCLHWVSVGDSRIYLYHAGQLTLLTVDHIYARELDREVAAGRLEATAAAAHPDRDALTSFLGVPELDMIDCNIQPVPLHPGDRVVLCSDGVYRALDEAEMREELARCLEPQAAAEALVNRVLARQIPRQDNLTVAILAVGEAGEAGDARPRSVPRRHRWWMALGVVLLLAGCAPSLEDMRASTVRVLCKQDARISTGSGFVVGDGQHIATNWHNAECTTKDGQMAVLLGPQQLAPARVVWKDLERDLAILAVQQKLNRPVAAFTTSHYVGDDEAVFVLGFPGAADDLVDSASLLTVKVSRGGISAQVRSEQGLGLYQIDAAINPGHSGGPIFNEAGRIIGVSVMKSLTLVPTISPDAQGKPEWGLERVPLAENIAWAIHIDELLPGLRVLGLPFTVDNPGPLEPVVRLTRREPAAALVLTMLLFLTAGGLWAWRQRASLLVGKPTGKTPSSASRSFRPQLRGLSGPFAGNVLDLPEGALAMGRDPRLCQLVFPAECAEVGRQHAVLRFDAQIDQFLLEDCGSRNGTFLEAGERLPPNQSHRLPPGTRFYLGDQRYRFEVGLAKR